MNFEPPAYWQTACEHLCQYDRVMRRLIPQLGAISLQPQESAFATLARSIVGQQISNKAAQTIWRKLENHFPNFCPEQVLQANVSLLREVGLSQRKVEYLIDLSIHFDSESLHPEDWHTWEDERIIKELMAVRGIGRWTAEMFLIFYLLRPDVLPLDDAGLIQAIRQNYFSGEPVSRSDVRDLAQAWVPFRSVATWYMWRSIDPSSINSEGLK